MKTANWMLITFYGILMLLFAIISSGQTAPPPPSPPAQQPVEIANDTTRANIFGLAPKVAKVRCTMGKRWADGKCRTFVD